MRCFIGIPLSNEVIDKLCSIQSKLKQSGTKMKLVEKENMHITIRFYGEIDEKRIDVIKQKMDVMKRSAFDIAINRIDAFPNKNFVRVIWAGIGKGGEELSEIGGYFGNKDLIPHITLARIKSKPTDALKKLFDEKLDIRMVANKIELIQSFLGKNGPRYEVLYEKIFD